jgi:hypothetical protein
VGCRNISTGLCLSTRAKKTTFHQSGSSKNMSSGIDALRELFNVSEARKAYNMTINFNTCNLDYDDVFDMRTNIVEVSFESLIKNYEYIPVSQEPPAWTNGYLRLTKQVLPKHDWSLRLILDTNRMLAFKISISKIIQMIREKAPPHIVVVPSPMAIGILDLYPDEDQMDNELGADSSLLFLSVSVLPTIQYFIISGVKGVEGIFPSAHPIISIILEEIEVERGGEMFYISFSRSQMKKTGLGIEELEKLFSYKDVIILPPEETGISPEEGAYVVMPKGAKSDKGYEPPTKYIKKLLDQEEKRMNEEEKMVKQKAVMAQSNPNLTQEEILKIQAESKGYMAKPSEFYKASKCWYADTNGKNFIDVIKLPEVDPLHTFSNDFHEISDILGIEATRTLLVMEFKNVLLSEEYINTRHIALLVDIMTNLGRLTPISFYGANRFGQGAMSLATNQQTMKVFTQAAAFGKKEKVDSVSASIMVGKQAKIGAGFVEVLPDKSKISIPQPNPSQFSDKIDQTYILEEEGIDPEINEETKQAYNDVTTINLPAPVYFKEVREEQKTPPESRKEPMNVVPTDVQIAPPKIISPNLIEVAQSIKNIKVIGETTLENSVLVDPEADSSITQAPIGKNKTVTEKIVLDIPEQAQPDEEEEYVIPIVAPPSFVKKSKAPVTPVAPAPVAPAPVAVATVPQAPRSVSASVSQAILEQQTSASATKSQKPAPVPPSLPTKKRTDALSRIKNIVANKASEKKSIASAQKTPIIDVDESIHALQDL